MHIQESLNIKSFNALTSLLLRNLIGALMRTMDVIGDLDKWQIHGIETLMAFVRSTGLSDISRLVTMDQAAKLYAIGNRRDGIDEQIMGKWIVQGMA